MKIIQRRVLTLKQKQSLFELWNAEYPERICYKELFEFESYLKELSDVKHFLLVNDLNQIFGWAFIFERERDYWFGIIIDSKMQGKKFGSLLLKKLKMEISIFNGWVIDNQNEVKQNKEPYLSPLGFYIKNGFRVDQNTRLDNERISAVKVKWERA